MFPFCIFWGRFLPELGSGKLVAKSRDFSRSLVSFRPGFLTKSRVSELTSGGWNSWKSYRPQDFSRRLVSFRAVFEQVL